ncbi:PsiA protein [compost metagenome]
MVWGWISRFPSLEEMDPEEWSAEPLWAVIGQVGEFARMRDERAKSLDAWLIPNKLPHRRG